MPWKDVVLLVMVGGLVLGVWFAFRNLEALATTPEEGKPPQPRAPEEPKPPESPKPPP